MGPNLSTKRTALQPSNAVNVKWFSLSEDSLTFSSFCASRSWLWRDLSGITEGKINSAALQCSCGGMSETWSKCVSTRKRWARKLNTVVGDVQVWSAVRRPGFCPEAFRKGFAGQPWCSEGRCWEKAVSCRSGWAETGSSWTPKVQRYLARWVRGASVRVCPGALFRVLHVFPPYFHQLFSIKLDCTYLVSEVRTTHQVQSLGQDLWCLRVHNCCGWGFW